jgi:tRNA-Thr(GGU) m(6)t(6)A37 methyltransferase TsaA
MSFIDNKMTQAMRGTMGMMFERRDGEEVLETDPATMAPDGHVVFIGRIGSPWKTRGTCPKNMRAARETGQRATLVIDAPYRGGLRGLEQASHVIILSWLQHAMRNLIVQKPRHASESKGVFALRSPARPNPVGVHVVRLVSLDIACGRLELDAIDLLDGTPVIDLKPYFASVDSVPDATVAERPER